MDFPFDFFAALRRMKAGAGTGVGLGAGPAVAAGAAAPPSPPPPPEPAPPADVTRACGPVGAPGLALIKRFESCARQRRDGRFEAYPDPGTGGAPWTIGWGATGRDIARGTIWTQAECDRRLERDLARCAGEVTRALGAAPTSPNQFDALVSFHYNTGAIARATLTRLHRAGRFDDAAREFARWINAGGRPLPGLIRRRQAEAQLYRRG